VSALSNLSNDSVAPEPNDRNAYEMTSPTLPPASVHPLSTAEREKLFYTKKSYRWNRKNYSRNARRLQIWAFVFQFLIESWANQRQWTYRGGYSDEKKRARQRHQAAWIRETFLDLGPTFIKLGQLFSTRADLFPVEYVEELSKLQDRVPDFDSVPLAAASLGQVHKAQLHSGEEVVVKVQRLGLRRLFGIDLAILKNIARYFHNHPDWGRGRDWLGIYDECCRILYEEIDYLNEGRNADTFRRNFRKRDWVKVPRVYWRYASSRVLTLEYVPGIKISNYEALEAAGLDRKVLSKLGAAAYLHQLLDCGFFHADPHPGNLAVSLEGALIFYDFGMMGQISTNVREKLLDTFLGVAQKDADRVVASLIELGALSPTKDLAPVRRSIQYILDRLMDRPFEEQSVAEISDDLYEIAYDQPFRFPATFTFVMRAFSTLEGVGKGLDPEFNFMEVAKPFALDIMTAGNDFKGNGLLGELSRQAAQVSNTALALPRRIEDTLDKLERGDIRVRVRASETDRLLRRISGMQMATNYGLMASAFTLSATILLVNGIKWLALLVAILAGLMGVALIRLLMRLNKYDRTI
jgi:predicted unusual protein kinase regulating ubiquinone biosynthesis (AarF/ABC1/UbiB family)